MVLLNVVVPCIAANMRVFLSDLPTGQQTDEWYTLNVVSQSNKSDMGSVRVSAKYQHEVIMPLKEYSSLKEVIRPLMTSRAL